MNTFKKKLKMNLIYVDASSQFFSKLKNVSGPEKKKNNNWKFIYKDF